MKALRTAGTSTVGPYQVVAELGRGGMGRVLLCSGPDGRLVAVKLVHDQLAEDDGFRARFRREVDASRAVSGAYTAAVVDADPDAATPWLASVFVPGPSLHEALSTAGALPETAVLRLAAGLASALTHIHQAGLVHRDLKPANVLLTDDGLRVIDFGIVRAASDSDELTRTGWLVGSPAFMSPEQADGGTVGPASDVFSLGSVVVAAATGTSPFVGATTLHTLTNIVRHDPDLSGVPDPVRRIVEPCLAKDPADRPAPAALLASIGQIPPAVRPWPAAVHQMVSRRQAEVGDLLEPGQDATVLVTGPPPRSTRVEARGLNRTRWWVTAVALVGTLALAGALVWAVWPSAQRPEPPGTTTRSLVIERIGTAMTGTSPVTSLMVSPDGSVVTALFEDRTVQSWDLATQDQIGQILGSFSGDGVRDATFAPDNRTLVTARLEGDENEEYGAGDAAPRVIVEHWDLATGRQPVGPFVAELTGFRTFDGPGRLALSPDGRVLAVSARFAVNSDWRQQVRLWDVNTRRAIGSVEEGTVWGFSPDSRTLLGSGLAGWDVATRRQTANRISLPEGESLQNYAFTDNGATQLTVSPNSSTDAEDAVVRWWDTASRNQLRQPITIDSSAALIALSPDGRRLASVNAMTGLTVWDLDTGDRIGEPIPDVTAVAFTPDGTLVTGNSDNAIQLWRLPTD